MELLKRILKKVLEKLHILNFVKNLMDKPTWSLANLIRSTQLKTDYLVDVGAHRGNFAREMFSQLNLYEGILFEPNPILFRQSIQELIDSNTKIGACEIGIGAKKGKSKLHIAANDGLSSSLLQMLDLHKDLAPESEYIIDHAVNIDSLDNVVSPDWSNILLKIDVQGFELKVLEGASETLKRTNVIVIETSFDDLYEGAPTPSELINYLYTKNFIIFQVIPVFVMPTGRWLQADLIMVKKAV